MMANKNKCPSQFKSYQTHLFQKYFPEEKIEEIQNKTNIFHNTIQIFLEKIFREYLKKKLIANVTNIKNLQFILFLILPEANVS